MARKNIIQKSAPYVQVCPDCQVHFQTHAWIVLPDGRSTDYFRSREGGRSFVRVLLKAGHIDEVEAIALNEQVASANLPESVGGADIIDSPEDLFCMTENDEEDDEIPVIPKYLM